MSQVDSHLQCLPVASPIVEGLPGDVDPSPRSRQVRQVGWSRATPLHFPQAQLLDWSKGAAHTLGWLEQDQWPKDGLACLLGQKEFFPHPPVAMCYGGHQFGVWADQLGDGRAMLMGRLQPTSGRGWDIQIKGLGPTAFARRGDGRAVLRSCLREHVLSEAIHYLGIPTTRSLALIGTGDEVARDPLYDHQVIFEPGAVVVRCAPHFLRFGSIELPASRGEFELVRATLTLAMAEQTGRAVPAWGGREISDWFRQVAEMTASLIVGWLQVGFVHGVMNTDNMSLAGLTIDYGPFGWVEQFESDFTANLSDMPGKRYGYFRQPAVGLWNLERLAQACQSLFSDPELYADGLQHYQHKIRQDVPTLFMKKLGLPPSQVDQDGTWLEQLFSLLASSKVDMTNWFYRLSQLNGIPSNTVQEIHLGFVGQDSRWQGMMEETDKWLPWWASYRQRLETSTWSIEQRKQQMTQVNPSFIVRNHVLQQVLNDLVAGDTGSLQTLMQVIETPYQLHKKIPPAWLMPCPPEQQQVFGCRYLSCSS